MIIFPQRWCLITPVWFFFLKLKLGEKQRGGGNRLLVLLARLLGEQDSVDVGEHTTLSDGDTGKELAQFLIIADSQLNVAGHNTGLLVVASGIAREFENLSSQVLEDGGEVHGGTSTDALCKEKDTKEEEVRKYQVEQRGMLNNPHRNSFQAKPREGSCATLATNVQQQAELLTSIASLLEVTGDTANRELKTGLG